MADFKTHLEVGAATGFALSIITYMTDLITHVYMAVIIFFATVIGSFLPDMDSNSGLPVKIIFGLYAYFAATITMYWIHDNGATFYMHLFLPAASFAFVKLVLEKWFKKYTTHRGIFHSFPAYLITFFASLLIASSTNLPVLEQFVISLAISSGYLCHLVLDEIYSINFLMSNRSRKKTKLKNLTFKKLIKNNFGFKSSFGTALDLGFNQKERYPGIIAYIVLVILIISCIPVIKKIWITL